MGKWSTRLVCALGAVIWAVCVAGGLKALETYAQAAGPPAKVPRTVSTKPRNALLIFLHPLCPCSQASLEELDGLLASSEAKVRCTAYFVEPKNPTSEWTHSALIARAKAIPRLDVQLDGEGKTAKSFGVATSGQVLYFNGQGELAFQGGITPSRGHQGDNEGRSMLQACLGGLKPAKGHPSPVYGCSLGELGFTEVAHE